MAHFNLSAGEWLWLICTAIALIGCVYAVAAAILIRRLSLTQAPKSVTPVAVTILKPLYGAEPHLATNLLSFAAQNYPSDVQIICGVADESDPAAAVVRNLMANSHYAFDLATNAPDVGPNRKISNVINMMKLRRHDLVALSDSDMRVGHDYLSNIIAPFEDPAVGLVTCLYRGLPVGGLWSRIHAASIDHHFLPNALIGTTLGLAEPCFGSTMALRFDMLQRIGGFEAFRDKLADDYELGRAIRATGAKTVIPPIVLAHTCSESTFKEVVGHELRWAKTIRMIDPLGYAGSIVTHPFPAALVATLSQGFTVTSLAIVGLTLACRSLIPLEMKRSFKAEGSSIGLGPLRDLLSFAIFLASFLPIAIDWRGHRYRVRRDGTMDLQ